MVQNTSSVDELTLTEMQQQVYDRVVNADQNQLTVLKGYAGTGKTSTAAKIITDLITKKNARVLVAAPTAAALAVLKQKLSHIHNSPEGFVEFRTLAQLLTIPERYVDFRVGGTSFGTFSLEDEDAVSDFKQNLLSVGVAQSVINSAIRPFTKMTSNPDGTMDKETQYDVDPETLLNGLRQSPIGSSVKNDDIKDDVRFVPRDSGAVAHTVHDFDLIMLDEISMVGQSSMKLFDDMVHILDTQYSHKHKDDHEHDFTQVLMCGDPAQLPPVQDTLNDHITAQADGKSVFQLTEILRSTDTVSQIAQLVRGGTSFSDLSIFFEDSVTEVRDADPTTYINTHVEELAATDVVLTFQNKHVNLLNKNLRLQAGHHSPSVEFGDRLLVTRNSGIDPEMHTVVYPNGSQYEVTKVYSEDEVKVMFKDVEAHFADDNDTDIHKAIQQAVLLASTIVELVDLRSKSGDVSTAWVFKDNQEWKHRYGADSQAYRNADKQISNFAQLTYSYLGEFRPLVHTNFGYAMTVHKSQGSEWPSVTYLVTQKDLNIMRGKPNLSYTAVSRAKETIKIIYLH